MSKLEMLDKEDIQKLIKFAIQCNDCHDGCLGDSDKELEEILGENYRQKYSYIWKE